jgi:N-acetylglucosamine-6-phosphate deacetylase
MRKRKRSKETKQPRRTIPTTVRVKNIKLLKGNKLVDTDLWYHIYNQYDSSGRRSCIIDSQNQFWNAVKERLDFSADVVIDGGGNICCPGFIDLQFNGAFGIDFSSVMLKEKDVVEVSRKLLEFGVTSYLPTVVTSSPETYHQVLPTIRTVKNKKVDCNSNNSNGIATILGIHCEGPFINRIKKGAHNETFILPTVNIKSLYELYGKENMKDISLITIAPELKGAVETIKHLSYKDKISVSIGHSMATYDEAFAAFENGAKKITHLFNAMSAFHHRDPGIVGLLGCEDKPIHYGLIADAFHAHPASVKMAWKSRPAGAVIVTDAMMAMGLGVGTHTLGEMNVSIEESTTIEGRKRKKAYITGKPSVLAGSVVNMIESVINFKEMTNCEIEDALYAATYTPAQVLNILNRKGQLNFGCDADFVILDQNNFSVLQTYIDGKLAYDHDSVCM